MKTKLQILTALALTIQVVVYGQTPGNQASHSISNNFSQKKVYPTLEAYNPKTQISQPVQTNQPTPVPVTENESVKNKLLGTGSVSAYNKSLLCKGTAKDAKELLSQADEMSLIEKQLRVQANTKHGEDRSKLIKSANELAGQIELIQIQASEINGKVNLETFNFNQAIYQLLIMDPTVNDDLVSQSEKLDSEAEQYIKLAKEMRQEAYAMPSNTSKLGTMLNAEEEELIALNKQKEAISILNKKSNVVIASK